MVDGRTGLPGGDLVARGVRDLEQNVESAEAFLISIGAPRLEGLGVSIPRRIPNPERRLYDLLYERHGAAAHARYNALVRRLVSFERAAAASDA